MKKTVLLSLIVLSMLCHAVSARASDFDPTKRVRIVECFNLPSVQLLLLQMHAPLAAIGEMPPIWQTIPSETLEEREVLYKPSVIGVYDMLITGSEQHARDLEKQGLLRRMTPLFSEKLILAGPPGSKATFAQTALPDILRKIFAEEQLFFSLLRNDWVAASEEKILARTGITDPGKNKNYVETGRDDLSALLQAGDEGGFMLVGEASFAQYQLSLYGETALEIVAETDFAHTTYLCLFTNAGFKKARTQTADQYAQMLEGEEGRKLIESFRFGEIHPFRAVRSE